MNRMAMLLISLPVLLKDIRHKCHQAPAKCSRCLDTRGRDGVSLTLTPCPADEGVENSTRTSGLTQKSCYEEMSSAQEAGGQGVGTSPTSPPLTGWVWVTGAQCPLRRRVGMLGEFTCPGSALCPPDVLTITRPHCGSPMQKGIPSNSQVQGEIEIMMRGERSLSSCHTGSPSLLPRLLLTPTGLADSPRGSLCEASASGAMTVNEAPSLRYPGPTITWGPAAPGQGLEESRSQWTGHLAHHPCPRGTDNAKG